MSYNMDELEDITLSEISQSQKDRYYVIPPEVSIQIHKNRQYYAFYWGWEEGEKGVVSVRFSVCPSEKILKICFTTVSVYTTLLKYTSFVFCVFYHN